MTLYEYFLNVHNPRIDLRDNGNKDANDIKYHCKSFGAVCPTDKQLTDLTDEEIYMVFSQLENGLHQPDDVVKRAKQKFKNIK